MKFCKNTTAGKNVEHDEVLYMTVYVKMFNRTTIGIKCGRKQDAQKIKEEVERKNKNPKEQQCFVCQGKALKDGMTTGECNTKENATIEMTAGIAGDRQVIRISSDPGSETSGFDEVKLSDVTAQLRNSFEKIRRKDGRNDGTNGNSNEANE